MATPSESIVAGRTAEVMELFPTANLNEPDAQSALNGTDDEFRAYLDRLQDMKKRQRDLQDDEEERVVKRRRLQEKVEREKREEHIADCKKLWGEKISSPTWPASLDTDPVRDRLMRCVGLRWPCILAIAPREFITKKENPIDQEFEEAVERMMRLRPGLFGDFDDDPRKVVDAIKEEFGVKTSPIEELPSRPSTTPTGLTYDANTAIISIETRVMSEFHPQNKLLMRASYWGILRALVGSCSTAVVVGDPGIGKSSLLRIVYALVVYGWSEPLKKVAVDQYGLDLDKDKAQWSKWKGVFWIMESGQFQYAWKHSTDQSVPMEQGEGVYGRGHRSEDLWRRDDVLLLVDGAVPTAFLAKITNIVVFASPQPSNYHRMQKATGAVRLTLPPWTQDEVHALVRHCWDTVRTRMGPYLNYIKSKASDCAGPGGNQKDTNPPSNVHDDEETKFESVAAMQQAANTAPPTESDVTTCIAQKSLSVWDYDDVHAYRCVRGSAASTEKDDSMERRFLQNHIQWRFDLVGGRIRLLLSQADTAATLKRQVESAIHAVSIKHLRVESSIDSHRYVPSVIYSLVPSVDPREPPEAKFASTTISCLVLAMLAEANGDTVVKRMAPDGGGSMLGSLLGRPVPIV